MGHSKSSFERKVHSIKALHQGARKIFQINHLMLHLKELEKEQQENPRVSKRKKIIKIREEIHDMETIKKYKRSMEPMEYKRSRVL